MLGNWLTWLWSLDKSKTCSSTAKAFRLWIQGGADPAIQPLRLSAGKFPLPQGRSVLGSIQAFGWSAEAHPVLRRVTCFTQSPLMLISSKNTITETSWVMFDHLSGRSLGIWRWKGPWMVNFAETYRITSSDFKGAQSIRKLITEHLDINLWLWGQSVFWNISNIDGMTDCPLGKSSKYTQKNRLPWMCWLSLGRKKKTLAELTEN